MQNFRRFPPNQTQFFRFYNPQTVNKEKNRHIKGDTTGLFLNEQLMHTNHSSKKIIDMKQNGYLLGGPCKAGVLTALAQLCPGVLTLAFGIDPPLGHAVIGG